ncbi:hypothetical protein KXX44_008477, partial [Aspergillus fumigatus]
MASPILRSPITSDLANVTPDLVDAPQDRCQTHPIDEIPGILHIHGGGLATGNRFLGFTMLDWVESLGAVCLTAEYRLAPEHHQPAQLEDSYAALQWMSDHAAELGFNPRKLVVC